MSYYERQTRILKSNAHNSVAWTCRREWQKIVLGSLKKSEFRCCVDCCRCRTKLPGFPFTVILPIYDIVDPYSYIALKPNAWTGKQFWSKDLVRSFMYRFLFSLCVDYLCDGDMLTVRGRDRRETVCFCCNQARTTWAISRKKVRCSL